MSDKPKQFSRRRFVQLSGTGLVGAAVLAACGDPTATTAPATTAATTAANTTAAAAATTASAATTAAAAGPLKKIKYALPTAPILSYIEAYIAKEGGFWEKEGLDVELVSGSGTASSLQQVSSKTAFAARGGAITTIINRTGQAVPIRSTYAVYRGVQFVIITNEKSGIKTPADMKGKTIGVVSRGGSTEQLLTLILAGANLKPTDVTLQVVGANTGAYAFLESGKVEAFVATNHVAVELGFNKTPIVVYPMSDLLKVPSDDVIVHEDSLKSEADTVQKMIAGLHKGRLWAQDPANLDKIVTYAGKWTPDEVKNVEIAKLKIQDDIKKWTGSGSPLKMGQIDKDGWASLQDQLSTAGLITKKLTLPELIDTTAIDKVEPVK